MYIHARTHTHTHTQKETEGGKEKRCVEGGREAGKGKKGRGERKAERQKRRGTVVR